MSPNLKRALQISVAVGVSVFFIWLSLRKQNLSEVWQAIVGADFRWVLAYVAILFVVHFLRVVRWGILLEPLAKVTLSDLNKLGAVGFMLLMILPLRLGEFGRPLLVARHLKVSKSASLASVVFERIVDGLAMGFLLVVLIWTVGPRSGDNAAFVKTGSALVTAGFGTGLIVLVLAVKLPSQTQGVVRLTLGRFMPKLATRIVGMMQAFTHGLRVLPSVGKAIEFFVLTGAYWFAAGYGLIVLGWAFGLPITLAHCFTILGLQVIGAMIPGGPGSAGTFQWFTQLGIVLFLGKSAETQAAAYANTIWAVQFAQQVLYGLVFVAIGHIDLHGLIGMPSGDDEETGSPDKSDDPDDQGPRGGNLKIRATSP
jgi:hypothetical protein